MHFFVLAAMMTVISCGGGASTGVQPEATWAGSREAQNAFRRISSKWGEASPEERVALEPSLVDFIQRYRGDAQARVARMYLAWIYVQQGRLDEARRLSREARSKHPGMVGDFGSVIEGAILIRQNQPERALALLEPFRGKLIDPEERLLFGGEIVRAALAAKQYEPAMTYMVDWLEQAPSTEVDGVQAELDFVIKNASPSLLEAGTAVLESEAALEGGDGRSPRARARDFLGRAIRVRLVRVALAERDVGLARRLLDATPPSFKRDPSAEALSRLASEGHVEPRIHGRALGVVLRLDDASSRKRSSQAIAGMSRALGLPGSASDPESIRLITRDAAEGVESVKESLSGLAGEGAAILVAAVSEEGAKDAAEFAETSKIPVIVLADSPRLPSPLSFTFVLGVAADEVNKTLEAALAARRNAAHSLVGSVDSCPAKGVAGGTRFPVAEWRRSSIDALVLLGDAECARDAIAEHDQAGLSATFVFGLECGELFSSFANRSPMVVATGAFPSGAAADVPSDMRAWQAHTGSPPTWFEALGHDAALLSKAVLASFPLERVDAATAVAELHRKARDTLATVTAALWTTRAKSFGGARRLPRKLEVVGPAGAGR